MLFSCRNIPYSSENSIETLLFKQQPCLQPCTGVVNPLFILNICASHSCNHSELCRCRTPVSRCRWKIIHRIINRVQENGRINNSLLCTFPMGSRTWVGGASVTLNINKNKTSGWWWHGKSMRSDPFSFYYISCDQWVGFYLRFWVLNEDSYFLTMDHKNISPILNGMSRISANWPAV